MNKHRTAAVAVLGLRIVYGGGLLVAPASLTGRWLGHAATDSGAQVAIRGLGAREIAVHAGALYAALGGRALRPWLAASIVGDLTDIAATAAARRQLPGQSFAATLMVGGTSALLTAAIAVTAPPADRVTQPGR